MNNTYKRDFYQIGKRTATFSNCYHYHIQLWGKDDFSNVFCSTDNYDIEVKEVREDSISLIKVSKNEDLNKSCSSLNNMKKAWFSW